MTRSKIPAPERNGKSSQVHPTTGKLLEDCGRCGRPVFSARIDIGRRVVAIEVLEEKRGDIGLQTEIGSDVLTAVIVPAPATYYRVHQCKGAFSRVVGVGKMRALLALLALAGALEACGGSSTPAPVDGNALEARPADGATVDGADGGATCHGFAIVMPCPQLGAAVCICDGPYCIPGACS